VNKPRPYKKEYEEYQGKPEQIKNRAKRNSARAELMKDGRVHKGDGKDVDHVKPLSKGGSSSKSNLKVKSASNNRSYSRNADHSVKSNKSKK
jgi:hypothetical protein